MGAKDLSGIVGEVLLNVPIEGGKYRYVQTRTDSHIYRHGEIWQDVTGNKMIYCFAAEVAELREQLANARAALRTIEAWKLPPTGKFWPNTDGSNTDSDRPMSYGACYGSNGERDYMRAVARQALP